MKPYNNPTKHLVAGFMGIAYLCLQIEIPITHAIPTQCPLFASRCYTTACLEKHQQPRAHPTCSVGRQYMPREPKRLRRHAGYDTRPGQHARCNRYSRRRYSHAFSHGLSECDGRHAPHYRHGTLGAHIEYAGNEGFPPLRINGTQLTGSEIELAGDVSSQYISALLMIGAVLPTGLKLQLKGNIISRPYINLTLQLMHDFGAQAGWTSDSSITVEPGGYHDTPFRVESDWSAASYWYQMTALADGSPEVELLGLFAHSAQGDSRGAELFARLGVQTEYIPQGVKLRKQGQSVARLDADMVDIPDLAQTFVVTCCLMDVPFRFTGLQSLKIKETDRICALITELRKLGYVVHAGQDSILWWDGGRCPADEQPGIDTYEDHRMAMAFAPVCLVRPAIRINEPQVVSKSYPSYWNDLQAAGFRLTEYPGSR